MIIFIHSATAAHGNTSCPDGPTCAGSIEIDYPCQAKLWALELEVMLPHVTRVWVPDLGREWIRDAAGKMQEQHPALDTRARAEATMQPYERTLAEIANGEAVCRCAHCVERECLDFESRRM